MLFLKELTEIDKWPDQKKIKNVGSDLPRDLQVPGVTCRAFSFSMIKLLGLVAISSVVWLFVVQNNQNYQTQLIFSSNLNLHGG